jgi:hypothetical protein
MRFMWLMSRVGCVFGLLICAASSRAGANAPVVISKNGHAYQFVRASGQSFTWSDADSKARTLRYKGMPGHLATITSVAENQFLIARFPGDDGWLGGLQAAGSAPDAGWRWVTGEKWRYTHWIPGEPNDNSGHENEDRLQWYRAGWNDSAAWRAAGFFVEFEPVPAGRHKPHAHRGRHARTHPSSR